MHQARSKGGGIAAVGFDPLQLGISREVLESHYCLQIAALDPECIEELSAKHIRSVFDIYESLNKSSDKWHEGRHDLRPWWEYFLGMVTAAYKEFAARVGTITSAKGAKRELVGNILQRLPQRFRFSDLQQACPGVSYPTLKRALADLKAQGEDLLPWKGP